jgi:hypothetical protein
METPPEPVRSKYYTYRKEYYAKNRDKINERNKKYYHNNKKKPEESKQDQLEADEAQMYRIMEHVRELKERDFQKNARVIPKTEIKTFMYY